MSSPTHGDENSNYESETPTQIASESSQQNGAAAISDDAELEALLDSAYDDLVKVETTKTSDHSTEKVSPPKTDESATSTSGTASQRKADNAENSTNDGNLDDFLSTMEAEFKRLMTTEDPNALADIQRLTEELQKAATREQPGASAGAPDFSNLFGMNNSGAEEFFASITGGAASGTEQGDPSASIMGALLSQLLSHDLLYPAIAQLRERYPDWLKQNQSSPDYERCSRQFEIVKQLCTVYEQQQEVQANGGQQNLTNIVSLVQDLQACGDPPAELLEHDLLGEEGSQSSAGDGKSSAENAAGDDCKVQ